ncbi:MAG: DUF1824 family protein [Chloroflexaceae bacterium]|nr:DUF1824 family protein [Chloroflexaceae bacterium]
MNPDDSTPLSLDEAVNILKQYNCIVVKNPSSWEEKKRLQKALLLVSKASNCENLGICADNAAQGYATLAEYLQALGYDIDLENLDISDENSPVYIKFNGKTMSYYLDDYTGSYRGVLVFYQSDDPKVVGTYGHFPINLFSQF